MTICSEIGEFETTIKRQSFLGFHKRKVKLKVTWVSSGSYSIFVQKAEELPISTNKHTEPKTDYIISMTPEQVDKVAEYFETALVPERTKSHVPFYEDYDPDRCMIDMGHDTLFQAFKQGDWVVLTNIHFKVGMPTSMNVLNMDFSEYKRFKEFLDGKKNEIFYSGVKIGPAGVEAVWAGEKKPDHVK